MHDVIIVGGGPAGLSAALILGRCRRKVVLYDDDKPRNATSRGVHGFLGQHGIAPAALRAAARAELRPYEIELRNACVVHAERIEAGFEVTDNAGERARARKLLLATGVREVLPGIDGVAKLYGRAFTRVRTATDGNCAIVRLAHLEAASRASKPHWR